MDSRQYPNRKYQDTVFHKLFSTKEAALELFNALEGTDYTEDTKIEITTLDNVLYLERKNDLGFTVASSFIFLGEQQSTINPNMPLTKQNPCRLQHADYPNQRWTGRRHPGRPHPR